MAKLSVLLKNRDTAKGGGLILPNVPKCQHIVLTPLNFFTSTSVIGESFDLLGGSAHL